MSNASMGHQAQLATSVDTATLGETTAVTQPFEFQSCTVAKKGTIIGGQGISGTRSHHKERTRTGPYTVSGQLILEPSPEELAIWIPRFMGAAASGTTFALAETLPYFNLSQDEIAKVFIWRDCVVAKATLTGSGGMLRLVLDIEARTETVGNSGSFPALTITHTAGYQFAGDPVLTLVSAAREVKDFELVIDNAVDTGRFMNSLTRVTLQPQDRIITLKATVPWVAGNTDLYDQALAGSAGTLVLTNGAYSTTFTFATLQFPAETPPVPGKGEIFLTLDMVARMSSTTRELVITHDSTP